MAEQSVEVQAIERCEWPGREGWSGRVVIDGGRDVLGVSRLDGSADWVVDSRFRGSLPVFVNGYGARYLRTDKIADADVVAQLEAIAGPPQVIA